MAEIGGEMLRGHIVRRPPTVDTAMREVRGELLCASQQCAGSGAVAQKLEEVLKERDWQSR